MGKYKISCNCRKPKNQMIKDLIKDWSINMQKSIMIGDKKSDQLAAKKSKLKFFYKNNLNYLKIKKLYKKLNLLN